MAIEITAEDATGPISGIEGNLSLGGEPVANLRSFVIDKSNDIKKYGSSSTGTGKKTLRGRSEWSGSAELYIEQGVLPTLIEGNLYALSGTLKTSGTPVTGVIRLGKVSVTTDVETGEPIGGSLTFEGHGELTQSTGT